jgi:hypothetical protein
MRPTDTTLGHRYNLGTSAPQLRADTRCWTHISADPRRSVATADEVVSPPDLVLISPISSFSPSSSPANRSHAKHFCHHQCMSQ